MEKSRSREQIFADMHRQLRAWNRGIPESPERMDPVVRILMQMYADQLARIDKRIDFTWSVAANSLIKALSPECKRWPVPAYTVMRCRPVDPVVEVDPHTRFFYKERREGGQTYFFTSLRSERIYAARLKHLFVRLGDSVVNLSPLPEGTRPAPTVPAEVLAGGTARIYVAIEYDGQPASLAGATVYLKASSAVQRQLRWAHWRPGSHLGTIQDDVAFCPGADPTVAGVFDRSEAEPDWGGLRTGDDIFKPLGESFVAIPESFALAWEMGPPPDELKVLLGREGADVIPPDQDYWWLRIDLPPGGDRSQLMASFDICFDCFIAVNRNELKVFKHTGGSLLMDLELPEPITSVLDISHVVDSDGREYSLMQQVQLHDGQRFYSLEEREDHLVLWFDFSGTIDAPPDSVSVTYTVTAGTQANGLEPGVICELYERHPGIEAAENLIATAGAIPAKTDHQIVLEATGRLRNRDRSVTFRELANWVRTFDPRLREAVCENGVERAGRGVRRCIVVTAKAAAEDFVSDDEIAVLESRLLSFLKSRSPANTQFSVRLVRE